MLFPKGNESIVNALLEHGVQTDMVDKLGKTALEFSLENGHTAIAEVLVDNDADIESKDSRGKKLLETFVLRNNEDAVQLIS